MVQPILYVTPHQDDEMLSMIASMRAAIGVGAANKVHVLLLTDGGNSGIQPGSGLTRDEFVNARDDELIRACRRLGVRYENVYIGSLDPSDPGTRVQDSNLAVGDPNRPLTPARAADMIADVLIDLGTNTWVKTLTDRPHTGYHSDHAAAGAGARLLLNGGTIPPNGLRFYVPPYNRGAFESAYPNINLGVENGTNPPIMRAALDEYAALDVAGFKHGFGDKSVPSYFDLTRTELKSYWHVP